MHIDNLCRIYHTDMQFAPLTNHLVYKIKDFIQGHRTDGNIEEPDFRYLNRAKLVP